MAYTYRLVLQGYAAKDRTTLNFDLGEPADYAAALSAANQIRGAFVDLTDANVRGSYLTEILEEDGTRPADDAANTFEEAVITCYTNVAGEDEKLVTLRVPAPIEAMFLSDGQTLDTGNALVIQYVQQVAQHAFVSDGEQINTAIDNGIKGGYKRSKARRFN